MLMAIKIKEVSVFPMLEIFMSVTDEQTDLLKRPELYWAHLNLMVSHGRIGRNILSEFMDSEFNHKGVDWIASKLLAVDRRLEKRLDEIAKKAGDAEVTNRRL